MSETINSKILNYALKLLNIRFQSENRLRQKIINKHHPEKSTIDTIIEYLKKYSYLDDQKFATQYLEYRLSIKPSSIQKLLTDLVKQDIPFELAKETINNANIDETSQATILVEQKLKYFPIDMTLHQKKQKISSHLNNQGFKINTILKIVNDLA